MAFDFKKEFEEFCNQARWAKDGQIADVFDRMSALLYDSKSVVVRQCLWALHEVALYRPEMSEMIIDASVLSKSGNHSK